MTEAKTRDALSALWIFMVLNYLYADVLGQFDPAVVGYIEAGEIDGMTIDSGFLLGAGVLMQLPIWMVLLSRWLPSRSNRVVNMGAAVFSAVVIVASNFIGQNEAYYVLYSAAELVGAGAIFAVAYRWRSTPPHSEVRGSGEPPPVPVGR